MKYLYFSVVSLLFSGCLFTYDPPQKGISVFNNTDSIWYVAYSFSDSLTNNYPLVLFEDVSIAFNEEHLYKHNYKKHKQAPCYRLNAYSYGCIGISGQETLLQRCDNNMLRLFFIPESIVRENSFAKICEYQLFEKKLTLTEAELKENDWVIVYE